MIDALRGLGDRLLGLGYTNPFLGMGYTDYYHSLAASKTAVQLVGNNILISGVPRDHAPMIFAFTGWAFSEFKY
jgi:alpha-aminoadipic semialdehyde synthase